MTSRPWRTVAGAAGCALMLCACQTLKPKTPPHLDVPGQPPPAASAAPPPPAIKPPPPPPAAARPSCVPKGFPKAPRYPDTDQALRDAGGAADRYQLMAAGRVLREHRLAELERLVEGCR
ncbi:MAG: hypothetical protein JSS35_18650 [Proteobacteria bacterium]|nr:hypothetical protein [Pseudomonadota bacterium]